MPPSSGAPRSGSDHASQSGTWLALGGMAEPIARLARVRLVQRASALDPADNRAAPRRGRAELPGVTDLVVLPEAFARDFGEPGSDLAPFAEPLDGPFAEPAARALRRTGAAGLAGMFETADDPGRPLNTLVLADGDGSSRRTARSTSTTRSATASPTRSAPGPIEPVVVDRRAASRSG